jgi:hypothetical protein
MLPEIRSIQKEWARVADIYHHYQDLVDGGHQKARGGASIGKAIELVEANAKSRGTGHAKLWEAWGKYKHVAHLATAAVLIADDVCIRLRNGSLGEIRLRGHGPNPTNVVMLMPDLILAVALELEQKDRAHCEGCEARLDHENAWCIPSDINVVPLQPPTRKIRVEDIAILNNRRAGNRGTANQKPAGGSSLAEHLEPA